MRNVNRTRVMRSMLPALAMLCVSLGVQIHVPGVSAGAPPKGSCPPGAIDPAAANLLRNASFEAVGSLGRKTLYAPQPGQDNPQSAASDWTTHTSNDGAKVATELVRSSRLGGGSSMLRIVAGSNEGGVYQRFAPDRKGPAMVVAQAWVFVRRGRVVIGTGHDGFINNSALNTTTGHWELLQTCSDGSTNNNWFIVYSTDVAGSDFDVDLAGVFKAGANVDQAGGMVIDRVLPNIAFPGATIEIVGRKFGHQRGTRIAAINHNHVDHLIVDRWSDTRIVARVPLDLIPNVYRVLVYYDATYRTSSNSAEVTIRQAFRR
jgi:hypothetical protein